MTVRSWIGWIGSCFALGLAYFYPNSVAVAANTEWRQLDTANFTIWADSGEIERSRIARCLEAARDFILQIAPQGCGVEPHPTYVYLFETVPSFNIWIVGHDDALVDAKGGTVFAPDGQVVFVGPSPEDKPCQAAIDQYGTVVVDRVFGGTPLWFRVGLREYLAAMVASRDQIRLGWTRAEYEEVLVLNRRYPLADLLVLTEDSGAYESGDRRSVFTAQSWAFVHYLFSIAGDDPEGVRQLASDLSSGEKQRESLEAFSGRSLSEMQAKLDGKIRKRKFEEIVWPYSETARLGVLGSKILSKTESALRGAELLARTSPWREEQTRKLLSWLETQTDQLTAEAPAELARIEGLLLERQGKSQAAIDSYKRSLEASPSGEVRLAIARILLAASAGDSTAAPYYADLLVSSPDDFELWLGLARARSSLDPASAAEAYLHGLELCPDHAPAWLELQTLVSRSDDSARDVLATWTSSASDKFNHELTELLGANPE